MARRVLTVDKRLCKECGLMRAPSPRDINYLPRGISLPRASRVADTMIDGHESKRNARPRVPKFNFELTGVFERSNLLN